MARKKLDRWLRELAAEDPEARRQAAMRILELQLRLSGEGEEEAFRRLLRETLTSHGFPAKLIVHQLFERFLAAQAEQSVISTVLAGCGEAALPLLPRLRELLSSPDMEKRDLAAKMIDGLESGAEAALDDLFRDLHQHFGTRSPDRRVRTVAKRAERDEAILDRVIAGLDSDDEKVYGASCAVIAYIGPQARRAVPKLLQLADRISDPSLPADALRTLGDGSEEVVTVLLRALNDERNWVRGQMISTLRGLYVPPERLVPALARLVESWRPPWEPPRIDFDPDFDDFGDALELLGWLGERASSALPALERRLAKEAGDDYETRVFRYKIEDTIARIRGEPRPDYPEFDEDWWKDSNWTPQKTR